MLWTPLGYDRYRESETVNTGESTMAQQMIIGIDLAKHVFQVCMVTPCICSHDTGHMWEAKSPHLTKLFKALKIKR